MVKFPVDSTGAVPIVLASLSNPPYTYIGGIKIDTNGKVVVSG